MVGQGDGDGGWRGEESEAEIETGQARTLDFIVDQAAA